MASSAITVIKIGGSLLATSTDLSKVVKIVAARRDAGERLVLVVSALKGVTDLLERELWRLRAGGAPAAAAEPALAESLWRRHAALAPVAAAAGRAAIERPIEEVGRLLAAARRNGGIDRRGQTRILSHGERMSAPLVAASLRAGGIAARALTAEEIGLRAAGPLRAGTCDLPASRGAGALLAREAAGRVPVVTGFYGLGGAGEVVLFGRNGTDYTAGALAALVGAASLEFWKDVPGYFSANPRRVPRARLVPELSFAEASALGRQGSRILHPRCLEPVWKLPVAVGVGPPDGGQRGTTLVRRSGDPSTARVRALAVRAPRSVVRLTGAALARARAVGAILENLVRDGFTLDAVGVSRASLCFSVVDDRPYDVSAALGSLNGPRPGAVSVHQSPAWIGIVGDGVPADPGVAAAVRRELAAVGAGPERISTPAGGAALRCRVERGELASVLGALHDRFFS